MDKNLDVMDRNLKKSEFIVKGMKSTFGFIRNIFKKAPKDFMSEDIQYPIEQ